MFILAIPKIVESSMMLFTRKDVQECKQEGEVRTNLGRAVK